MKPATTSALPPATAPAFSLFSGVPTGNYDVQITAAGFKGFEQNAIHLDPGDQRSVRDIHLNAGGANDTVDVTSGSDSINLDSGEQSSLISSQDIAHLSVEGRDVTELFKILPGFAISRGGGGNIDNQTYDPSQVSVNGALGSYAANGTPLNGVALLSDGADVTDPGNFGAAVQNINYEQVAEVKVQTSSFTDDGACGPIVVNAVGKSGGNKYHGSLYTYARTSQLNSTDWIANYTGQQKPPDRQVYPGFTEFTSGLKPLGLVNSEACELIDDRLMGPFRYAVRCPCTVPTPLVASFEES